MAISWGSYNGHLRFGIDAYTSGADSGTTRVTVYVKLYIQCDDNWNFNDTQSWRLSGTGGSSGSFSNTLANGETKLLYSTSFSAAIDYDGGPTYSYSASLSGAYNGASPSASRSVTLPARPPGIPNAPSAPTVSSITATSATLSWGIPNTNGDNLDTVNWQVSTSSSFSSTLINASSSWATSKAVTGLPKGTTLYARLRVHNSPGWSAWGPARQFETLSTASNAPGISGITGIGPTSATVAWSKPSDTGGETVTAYEVQRATNSSFTDAVTASRSTSPLPLTGLQPGRTYYVRVRAITSAGSGTWSGVESFKTLSGVMVGNGSSWVPAIVWVGDGTKWVQAQVKVGDGSTWK